MHMGGLQVEFAPDFEESRGFQLFYYGKPTYPVPISVSPGLCMFSYFACSLWIFKLLLVLPREGFSIDVGL